MTIRLERYDPTKTYTGQKNFDCGNATINSYVKGNLKKHAKANFCVANALVDSDKQDQFVGFYTIAQHVLDATKVNALQLGSIPSKVPCTRLVMLGVDLAYQKQALGLRMMRDAFKETKAIAQVVGSLGIYLDADPAAVDFYLQLGFILLEGNLSPHASPMFLMLGQIP